MRKSNGAWRKIGRAKGPREGTGQIVRLYAEVATVQLGEGAGGDEAEAVIRAKLYRADPPAVGDYVKVERAGGRYVITEILPRKSALVRRAAGTTVKKQVMIANIDQVVVVFAAARPEPNRAALDRFLVVTEANDLQAVIVVNKLDLVDPDGARALLRTYEEAGYPVYYTSVVTGQGEAELKDALRGKRLGAGWAVRGGQVEPAKRAISGPRSKGWPDQRGLRQGEAHDGGRAADTVAGWGLGCGYGGAAGGGAVAGAARRDAGVLPGVSPLPGQVPFQRLRPSSRARLRDNGCRRAG